MRTIFTSSAIFGATKTAGVFGFKHLKAYLFGGDESVRKELEATRAVAEESYLELVEIRKILRDIEAKGDMTL